MVDSWEELKIKKLKKIPQLILLFFILIISNIFIINNFDFFTKKSKTKTKIDDLNQNRMDDGTIARGNTESPDSSKDNIHNNKVVDSISSLKGLKEKNIKASDTSKKSVELHGIKCLLTDKDSLTIQVSLKLLFKDEKIKQEILLKRDAFINIIKKIVKKKKLSDIAINKLRIECKSELNKLLKRGKIDDVEFIDFRPLNSL